MNLTDAHLLNISKIILSENSISIGLIKNFIVSNQDLFDYFKYDYDINDVSYSLIRWASAFMILETNCQVFTKNGIIKFNDNYGPLLLNKSMIYSPVKLIEWVENPSIFNLSLSSINENDILTAISLDDSFCKKINKALDLYSNLSLDDYYKIWFILSFLYYSIFVNKDMLKMMLLKFPGALIDWSYNMQNNHSFYLKDNIGKDLNEIKNNFEKVKFKTKYYKHNRCHRSVFDIQNNFELIKVNSINDRMFYHLPFKEISGDNHCCTRTNSLYTLYLFGSVERNRQYVTINQSNNLIVNRKVNIF
jgi:hypothetical protein